jgi:hypothetical protein
MLLAACADHADSSPIEPNGSAEPGEAGESGAAGAAVDIVADRYARSGADDPNAVHYTDEEARCTAERIVRSLGVDRLVELGLVIDSATPPELVEPPLTEDEGDAVFAAIEACVDLEAQMMDVLAGGDASESDVSCVVRQYLATDLPRRAILARGYDPQLNAEIQSTLEEAGRRCGAVFVPD